MPSKYYSFVVIYILVGTSLSSKPHTDRKTSGIKKISGKKCNNLKVLFFFFPESNSSVKTARKTRKSRIQFSAYVLDYVCVIAGCMHSLKKNQLEV